VSSAVMKITGVVEPIAFNRRCISMPDIPPMCVYVEDNARHIARAIAVKKCLSGTEGFRSKVRRVQYPLEPPQDAGFVINDCYSSFCRQITQPETRTRTVLDRFFGRKFAL
jgi:hypothetical protein